MIVTGSLNDIQGVELNFSDSVVQEGVNPLPVGSVLKFIVVEIFIFTSEKHGF